jgi:hypothetical protein
MAEELAGFLTHRFVAGSGQEGRPSLLLLHGTGGNENDLLPLGRELLPGTNLISPRGKVLEHGMPRFFRRLAEGVFDEEDLKLRTEELTGFIEEASKRYRLEPSKLFAVGFSNGANIAASLLMLRPRSPARCGPAPTHGTVRARSLARRLGRSALCSRQRAGPDGAQGEHRAPRRSSEGRRGGNPGQMAADRARPGARRGRGDKAVALSGGAWRNDRYRVRADPGPAGGGRLSVSTAGVFEQCDP